MRQGRVFKMSYVEGGGKTKFPSSSDYPESKEWLIGLFA